jgi:hypothetical protein
VSVVRPPHLVVYGGRVGGVIRRRRELDPGWGDRVSVLLHRTDDGDLVGHTSLERLRGPHERELSLFGGDNGGRDRVGAIVQRHGPVRE